MNRRNILPITILIFGWSQRLFARGRDSERRARGAQQGREVVRLTDGARSRTGTRPPTPECKMVWRVLAEPERTNAVPAPASAWPSHAADRRSRCAC